MGKTAFPCADPPLSQVLETVAREVAAAALKGIQIAIVVGGGNYFRGASAWEGLERASADYVGMLATCMNAIQLQVISADSSLSLCLTLSQIAVVKWPSRLILVLPSHRTSATPVLDRSHCQLSPLHLQVGMQ